MDFTDHTFEGCSFSNCRFSELKLAGTAFISCVFETCEFVITEIQNVSFNDTLFDACKLLGINFTNCNDFGFSPRFKACLMKTVVFNNKNLKSMPFESCEIVDCDFTESDLRDADFSNSFFKGTRFHQCDLRKADFRTARGYEINPITNKIVQARFTLPEAQSFLLFLGIDLGP